MRINVLMNTSSGRRQAFARGTRARNLPYLKQFPAFFLFLNRNPVLENGVAILGTKRSDASEEKGPAASNEDADPAHDPRVWIVPGHRRADVVHRQAHSGPRGLLASQGTERGRAGNSLPVLRA
jgi:hypothetical protein